MLGEVGAHLGGGAVAVVGERLDDHRDAARRVALVADHLVILALAALRFFDRALDIVLLHVFRARRANMAARRRGFIAGSGRPIFADTVISRASLPNNLARAASARPFLCMIFLNCECPAMIPPCAEAYRAARSKNKEIGGR